MLHCLHYEWHMDLFQKARVLISVTTVAMRLGCSGKYLITQIWSNRREGWIISMYILTGEWLVHISRWFLYIVMFYIIFCVVFLWQLFLVLINSSHYVHEVRRFIFHFNFYLHIHCISQTGSCILNCMFKKNDEYILSVLWMII